jgi:hypothetical protein
MIDDRVPFVPKGGLPCEVGGDGNRPCGRPEVFGARTSFENLAAKPWSELAKFETKFKTKFPNVQQGKCANCRGSKVSTLNLDNLSNRIPLSLFSNFVPNFVLNFVLNFVSNFVQPAGSPLLEGESVQQAGYQFQPFKTWPGLREIQPPCSKTAGDPQLYVGHCLPRCSVPCWSPTCPPDDTNDGGGLAPRATGKSSHGQSSPSSRRSLRRSFQMSNRENVQTAGKQGFHFEFGQFE